MSDGAGDSDTVKVLDDPRSGSIGIQGRPRVYTDERCFEAIREIGVELGRRPTIFEYHNSRSGWMPSPTVFLDRFGSWIEAWRLATAVEE